MTPIKVLSLLVSTFAFFLASYFIRRWADRNDLPKGMTRSTSIFVLAIAFAYGVAWLVDKVSAIAGP